MKEVKIHRGDIFYCNLEPVKGSVQGGIRPVVVIQNQIGNNHSSTTIVAVITTIIKKTTQPTHIVIGNRFGLNHKSMIMLEHIKTIDKCELLGFIGKINDEAMLTKLDQAISISLGLNGRK